MIYSDCIDAHEMAPNLWQGSVPPRGSQLADEGFNVLVLCAIEYQPESEDFENVRIIRAPFNDCESLSLKDNFIIANAVNEIAKLLLQGNKILVTCFAGLNRSGLITAMVMNKALNIPGKECIRTIQSKRYLALSNKSFARVVNELK